MCNRLTITVNVIIIIISVNKVELNRAPTMLIANLSYIPPPPSAATADWLQTCELKSADFVDCSTESIQKLFQKLVTGVDGLDAVETIDPMKLAKIRIFSGDGPVSINSSISKAIVTGFGNVHVKRSRYSEFRYFDLYDLMVSRANGCVSNGRDFLCACASF